MKDIPAMLALINGYARDGIMLPRNEFELSEGVRDFTVLEKDGIILGCAALHFYGPAVAEVRSLAVLPNLKGSGTGRMLMDAIDAEARAFDLDLIFAFTYVPGFFAKMGYRETPREELPLKAWKDCLRCPKFQACDEIAVVRALKPDARLDRIGAPSPSLIQLPVLSNH